MKNLLLLSMMFSCLSALASPQQDSSDIFYQKGLEEKSAKRYLVAANNFDKAIALNPNFTQAYLENGYVNLEMRRSEAAKVNFTKVTQLDPNNTLAIKELINIYYSHHQYQQAIDFALKCKTCGNNDRIIALSYYQLEDYGKAEKGLVAVLAKDPSDALAAYTLGRTYMEMELEAKAITWYQKAVELDPSKASWAQELGLLSFNAGNFKNAVVYFNKAAANGFTQSNDFKENLGFAYFYSRDYEKGEQVLNEVLAKKPGNKDILRDLAQGFYDYKLYDKSLEYCQRLMELDAKDGQALYQAGLCFQKKGQKEKGQAMCDKAIEMDPSLNNLRKQQMLAAGL